MKTFFLFIKVWWNSTMFCKWYNRQLACTVTLWR